MKGKRAFKLFLCCLCFFHLSNSSADTDCSAINLEENGKPMKQVPVLDQGSAGYCFAYAAAELMDAWRFSHGDARYDQLVSPIPLAMHYGIATGKKFKEPKTSDHSDRFGEGGETCSIINAISTKSRSVCTQAGVLDRYQGDNVSVEKAIRDDILPEDYQND